VLLTLTLFACVGTNSGSAFANPAISTAAERPQPAMFEGKLKGYQLKVRQCNICCALVYCFLEVLVFSPDLNPNVSKVVRHVMAVTNLTSTRSYRNCFIYGGSVVTVGLFP